MNILIAPDSFKGSLSSMEIINTVKKAIHAHFKDARVIDVPIADGGEGTVEAIVTACRGSYKKTSVLDPLLREITATYGVIDNGKTAIIEMAEASGLMLLKQEERDPLKTSTYGTGQLIKRVLDEGIRNIIIGIGGSSTNDGGIGAAMALGVNFLDADGNEIGHGGKELLKIETIDISNLDPRLKDCNIKVICDVTNPLTGKEGATFIYGGQKGANKEILHILEEGMVHYRHKLEKLMGEDVGSIEGAGAAGGLGAALLAFFKARLLPGIETVLDIIDFESLLQDVDLVITGEGNIDGQSIYGKVPVGVGKLCKEKNIPVLAIVGGMGVGAQDVYNYGIDSIMVTVNKSMALDEAMNTAEKLLYDSADRALRMIKMGMRIQASKRAL
ncbi:MAG: glycerate kinase [Clostridiales bacterium]|nr:glycerate kinase [Clostridiales bacterium]